MSKPPADYPTPPEIAAITELNPETALTLGMWITHMVASWFYRDPGNLKYYQRAAIDFEDLLGHLRYYILTERYLPTVEKNPTYYTVSSFRASLYQACRKACFAHYRKHVRSLKRGIALRDGASVSLDETVDGREVLQLVDPSGEDRLSQAVIDAQFSTRTGCCFLDRCVAFLAAGGTWQALRAVLCLEPSQREIAGTRILRHLTGECPVEPVRDNLFSFHSLAA